MTFENDLSVGLHIELYTLKIDELKKNGQVWLYSNESRSIQQRRMYAFFIAIGVFVAIALTQIWVVNRINRAEKAEIEKFGKETKEATGSLNLSEYVTSNAKLCYLGIGSAIANSFFVGGLTFGYSGMALILRKEGLYAGGCACGSFW